MYRTLMLAALCFHTVSTAPQDKQNSQITYFKSQPFVGASFTDNPRTEAEQAVTESSSIPAISNVTDTESVITSKLGTEIDSVEVEPVLKVENDTKIDTELADEVLLIVPEEIENQTKIYVSIDPLNDRDSNNDEDIIPSESKFEREARDFEDLSTSSYESETVYATERSEELFEDTKTSPKYAPKLGQYKKYASHLKNHFESSGKRKFRSRCRCEKIWNCPKLQISVPRCPEEQFMCCF